MTKDWLIALINQLQAGELQADDAVSAIRQEMKQDEAREKGYLDLGFAKVDLDRRRRNGFSEVIFCPGKKPEHVAEIAKTLLAAGENVLASRVSPEQAAYVCTQVPELIYDQTARALYCYVQKPEPRGKVGIISAGTADLAVAEEAALTAEFFGLEVTRYYDVGVAGIHRLLDQVEHMNQNHVIIAVAGMEGALVSVLGGLTDKPLLAVPSGIGYGAGAEGITTLLAMLNSCASGVSVFNIGNGFGAAYMAATIIRQIGG